LSPVNTDELDAALFWAERRVLSIQAKLHCWARDDPHRRFDDLFNLVADPAFLLVAWDRVRGNKGARTAGVDGRTARSIEAGQGAGDFLDTLRSQLKDRSFRPLPVRERMIPKTGGKLRRLGIGTVVSYCPSCSRVLGWIRCRGIGAGHGRALVLSRWQLTLTFPGAVRCRWRGLVLRAAGLRCPDWSIRARHSAWTCLFQGMCSRLPAPRRAASLPVSIQS
jgi:hypothetical protein